MRQSKILLINIGTLGNEIAKNLVLTGVGSLSIFDNDKKITKDDSDSQYLIESSKYGVGDNVKKQQAKNIFSQKAI